MFAVPFSRQLSTKIFCTQLSSMTPENMLLFGMITAWITVSCAQTL